MLGCVLDRTYEAFRRTGTHTDPTAPNASDACTNDMIWYPRVVPATFRANNGPVSLKENPTASRAFLKADEGTRTLDLLHGKQTL